jgi:hypothetical protein
VVAFMNPHRIILVIYLVFFSSVVSSNLLKFTVWGAVLLTVGRQLAGSALWDAILRVLLEVLLVVQVLI